MRLAHLHIPRLIPYTHSLELQSALVERHFQYKDSIRAGSQAGINTKRVQDEDANSASDSGNASAKQEPNVSDTLTEVAETRQRGSDPAANTTTGTSTTSTLSPPDPILLTFSTHPTYTVGRRHLQTNPISSTQQDFLTSNGLATFYASPRGGLLTYHAPGQLTGYIVADLRRHGITARCWVKLLEESVMRTCLAWGVQTTRTDDPGVWIKQPSIPAGYEQTQDDQEGQNQSDHKICAIGVQVSRGITSHGIGLNVFDATFPSSGKVYDFTPAQTQSASYSAHTQGYLSWGFSRIVACGLEGKSVTWLAREGDRKDSDGISLEAVADVLAREVARGLKKMKRDGKEGVDGVYRLQEEDILSHTE
ncbi:lipoyl transferase [Exophiala viscosa]|uniref:Lipoyl transferase n=1 Tax=Exophiala viscosa TaxID=2486360 RepID=A0AAN6E224_9EURO|nr:lipoyl transferase [Exophiala viscosa]KAI1630067.1 lipoyl transferase [Exophiala viscosa]